MPISDHDPRVFFAAERTLLAWLRTGLTFMGLGFVIARFGLFLQFLSYQASNDVLNPHAGVSAVLGILFVTVGALSSFVATLQHRQFVATLPSNDLPRSYSSTFVVLFGMSVSLLGMGLVVYLAVT